LRSKKLRAKTIAANSLSRYENDGETFLDRIIAVDETWIRDFEPELKSPSNIWKGITSPRTNKVRRQQTKVKEIMTFAYDKRGIIVTDRIPIGCSVTGDYYKTFVATKLRQEIRKTRPRVGAPVVALLDKYRWERLDHSPRSPDLSPPEFDLFSKPKEPLRRIRFSDLNTLNENVSRRARKLDKDGVLCGVSADGTYSHQVARHVTLAVVDPRPPPLPFGVVALPQHDDPVAVVESQLVLVVRLVTEHRVHHAVVHYAQLLLDACENKTPRRTLA